MRLALFTLWHRVKGAKLGIEPRFLSSRPLKVTMCVKILKNLQLPPAVHRQTYIGELVTVNRA